MTREQAVRLLEGKAYMFYGEVQLKALAMAIEALEQQTCDNCKFNEETDGMNCYECVNGISDNFEALQQEPKRGYWLEAREEDPCWYICSECGRMVDDDSDYCPNCGARMESDEE